MPCTFFATSGYDWVPRGTWRFFLLSCFLTFWSDCRSEAGLLDLLAKPTTVEEKGGYKRGGTAPIKCMH